MADEQSDARKLIAEIHRDMKDHRAENAVIRHELAQLGRGVMVLSEASLLLIHKVMDMAGRNQALMASAAALVAAASSLSNGATKLADYKSQNDATFDKLGQALAQATDAVKHAGDVVDNLNKEHEAETAEDGKDPSGDAKDSGVSAVMATVLGATTAGTRAIPVEFPSGAKVKPGDAVEGHGVDLGTTVSTGTDVASGLLVLTKGTTADHMGDGSEKLTITPSA